MFADEDLHAAMKLSLDTLVEIINQSGDLTQRGNAAINLAHICLELMHLQEPGAAFEDIDEEDTES